MLTGDRLHECTVEYRHQQRKRGTASPAVRVWRCRPSLLRRETHGKLSRILEVAALEILRAFFDRALEVRARPLVELVAVALIFHHDVQLGAFTQLRGFVEDDLTVFSREPCVRSLSST
jgi:hypothetical protein